MCKYILPMHVDAMFLDLFHSGQLFFFAILRKLSDSNHSSCVWVYHYCCYGVAIGCRAHHSLNLMNETVHSCAQRVDTASIMEIESIKSENFNACGKLYMRNSYKHNWIAIFHIVAIQYVVHVLCTYKQSLQQRLLIKWKGESDA